MPTNQAFAHEEREVAFEEATSSREMRTDMVQTTDGTLEEPRPGTVMSELTDLDDYCCCACFSWTKMCETLGNRQGKFISTLRPLRGPLVFALQALKRFELELERNIKSRESAEDTSVKVMNVVNCINALTTHIKLNIPPEENQMLRAVANDLVILQRVIDEVAFSLRNNPSRLRSSFRSNVAQKGEAITIEDAVTAKTVWPTRTANGAMGTTYKPEKLTETAPSTDPTVRSISPLGGYSIKTGPKLDYTEPEIDANLVTTVTRTYDEHSLKERISRNCDRIEQLIRFVDQKCERRWWLRDLINFSQLFIKLALFVSASVSVVYHKDITPSIVTLVVAVLQGVIELLDQFFIKNKKPEDVKLSVFTGTVKSTTTTLQY